MQLYIWKNVPSFQNRRYPEKECIASAHSKEEAIQEVVEYARGYWFTESEIEVLKSELETIEPRVY